MKCLNGIFNTEGLFWNLHAILFWEIIFCLLMCAFYSSWFIPNEFLLIYQGFELVDYVARLVKIYISSFEGSFIHSFKCVIHFHLFRFLLKNIYIFYFLLKYGRELETKSLIWLCMTKKVKISSFHKTSLNYTIIDKFLSRKISKISSHKEF